MNRTQRKACFREVGVDYIAQETVYMVELLDQLTEACTYPNVRTSTAWALQEEIVSAALEYKHGATGKTLRVVVSQHPETGRAMATIENCRGDA